MSLRHLLPALVAFALAAWPATPPGAASDAARLRRFNDLKFGMFIHWGPYSLASVEASWPIMRPSPTGISEAQYRALPQRFNPVQFDPRAWIRLAREAGQRYMVFTTKHHDGFCMFDSAYTDYKITNTPYHKDIVALLAEAARREGMPLGFYYSPPDMHHPGYRDTSKLASTNWNGEPDRGAWPSYLDYMDHQLCELLTRYGDVFVVWFDGLGHPEKYQGARFHKLIRSLQPNALINNRIGLPGDFATPEQRLPAGIPRRGARIDGTDPGDAGLATEPPSPAEFQPWETCMTINETWAYNRHDRRYKSSRELIRALIDAASKGGNFLLNVGPTPEGVIQPEFQERLRAIGAWLRVNGEAIYGTTYGPLQNLPFGRTTAKGTTVYLHVFDWPAQAVELTGFRGRVTAVRALSGRRSLRFTQAGNTLRIRTVGLAPDPDATVLAISCKPSALP